MNRTPGTSMNAALNQYAPGTMNLSRRLIKNLHIDSFMILPVKGSAAQSCLTKLAGSDRFLPRSPRALRRRARGRRFRPLLSSFSVVCGISMTSASRNLYSTTRRMSL